MFKVKAWNMALVIKDNKVKKVLAEGTHWLWPTDHVLVFDMKNKIAPDIGLAILLKNQNFVEHIHLVEVKDNEVVLKFENGLFTEALQPGRHAFWKGFINFEFKTIDLNSADPIVDLDPALMAKKDIANLIRIFQVEPFEKALVFVDGKFVMEQGPGVFHFWKNASAIVFNKVDMRLQQMELSGQEMLSKDKAVLRVNFFAQFKIVDAVKAVVHTKELEKQLHVLLQLALRELVGSMSLDELLDNREAIAIAVLKTTASTAEQLGVQIVNAGIRDLILPGEMKDILNQVLVAEKKAQANTIMRREETAATRSLLNTAKLMEDNSMLFKLKEMEFVEKVAEKINQLNLNGSNNIGAQLKQLFN